MIVNTIDIFLRNETIYSQTLVIDFLHILVNMHCHLHAQHVGFHSRPVRLLNVSELRESSLDIAASRHNVSVAFPGVNEFDSCVSGLASSKYRLNSP